jgi:hypothetical protein
MQLLALHKKVDEAYIDFYHCVKSGYARVHHITPKNQMAEECGQELTLFTILSGLLHDNSLHWSLIVQRSLTLGDTFSAFLHMDAGDQAYAKLANITSSSNQCYLCSSPKHFACDCHHHKAINQLVAQQNSNSTGNGNSTGSCRPVATAPVMAEATHRQSSLPPWAPVPPGPQAQAVRPTLLLQMLWLPPKRPLG